MLKSKKTTFVILKIKAKKLKGLSELSKFCLPGRWVAKLVACLLAMAALWVRIQTSLKNTKWVDSLWSILC
jgi:steroid 5-alpha reductase family enzyme